MIGLTPLLIAVLMGWVGHGSASTASPLSIIHTFQNAGGVNADFTPTLVGTTLYGVTQLGGIYGKGIVFKVNTDGTGYSALYNFTGGRTVPNPHRLSP